MSNKFFWLAIPAIILSFIGGFMFANALNKTELSKLRAEAESLKNNPPATGQTAPETELSAEEIQKRIAEADQNPTNFDFQKNLGLALYRYAAMKQNVQLFGDIARLLTRAYQNDPKDYDVLISLGNVYFDIGYLNKENEQLIKSREFYQAALKIKPAEADVRTDLGLTYFLTDPPETDKAIAEFEQSLKVDPAHEKTLQVLAEAFISQNKPAQAEQYLNKLEKVNPDNAFLSPLKNKLRGAETVPAQSK